MKRIVSSAKLYGESALDMLRKSNETKIIEEQSGQQEAEAEEGSFVHSKEETEKTVNKRNLLRSKFQNAPPISPLASES